MEFSQETEQKYMLISKDLQEILGGDEIKKIINRGDIPKIYWGTAPTDSPHLAYLYQMIKIRDIVMAGCDMIILIADLHAFLDSGKSSLDNISARSEHYENVIRSLLKVPPCEIFFP